ncbi:MAG: MFS transporter [Chitinophagaceae bacterium]
MPAILLISVKRKLLLTGIVLYLFAVLILLLLSTSYSSDRLSNHAIVICIYIVIFYRCCKSVHRPTFGVMVAYIVPKEILQNATTLEQGTWLSASVTGHAICGFLIAGFGITGTLITITLLIIASSVFLIRLKQKPALNKRGEKKTWESVKEGLKFVF